MAKQKLTRKERRAHKKATQVVFHSYPKLIFVWPIIVLGLLFFVLPFSDGQSVSEVLGWIYLIVTVTVLLALSVDIPRNYAAFWLVVILCCYFLGLWLSEKEYFTGFGELFRIFANLDVQYSTGFGLSMSVFLGVPYVIMFVWTRMQHRWRITHNEFEHYAWGKADDSLARGAKRVRSTYPDLLELLLLGAGTLIVYSATGKTELRRIPNVPLLFLVRRRINRLMESTSVTVTDAATLEAEEVESEAEEDEQPAEGEGRGGEPVIHGDEPL